MTADSIPVKAPEGHAELATRRLRRARTRADLIPLLDEVESRVGKRRALAATQSLTSARQLLGPGLDTTRSAA